MSRREERERTEFLQRQQQDAINRSIDETKDNIRRTIEEVRRETPRYSQTVTDFQNETAEATREIADNFLDSQKEVINSMQSAWTPFAERTSSSGSGNNNYWMMGMMMQPWWSWWMGMSPRDMVNIYARSISVMTDLVTASTRMATNMMFAGIEASRATTNYAKYSSKEIARITSNTARIFGQNTRETVSKMQEGSYGGQQQQQQEQRQRRQAGLQARLKRKKQILREENRHKKKKALTKPIHHFCIHKIRFED